MNQQKIEIIYNVKKKKKKKMPGLQCEQKNTRFTLWEKRSNNLEVNRLSRDPMNGFQIGII